METMNTRLVKVEGKTRDDLLAALSELGGTDADFSGENGVEYLWEEAKGFESNREYLLSVVKDRETDKEVIEEYLERWVGADNYYHDYDVNVIYDDNGKAEVIALATLS